MTSRRAMRLAGADKGSQKMEYNASVQPSAARQNMSDITRRAGSGWGSSGAMGSDRGYDKTLSSTSIRTGKCASSPKRKRGDSDPSTRNIEEARLTARFTNMNPFNGDARGGDGMHSNGTRISPLSLRGADNSNRMPETAQHTPSFAISFVSPTGVGSGRAGASSDGTPSPTDISMEISPPSLLDSSVGSSRGSYFGARPRSDLGHSRASRTINDKRKSAKSTKRQTRRKNRRRRSDGDQAKSRRGGKKTPVDTPVVASHGIVNIDTPSLLQRFDPQMSYPPRNRTGVTWSPKRSHSTPRDMKTPVHGRSIFKAKRNTPDHQTSAGRVLPDQNAFAESQGLGDSHASHASRADATPGGKQCPPTPQRTPNWMQKSGHSHKREGDTDISDSMDGFDGFTLNHFDRSNPGRVENVNKDTRNDSGDLSASDLVGLDEDDHISSPTPQFASRVRFEGEKSDAAGDSDNVDSASASNSARSFPSSAVQHRRRRSDHRHGSDAPGYGYFADEAGGGGDSSPGNGNFADNSADDSIDLDTSSDRISGRRRSSRFKSSKADSDSDNDFGTKLDFENDGFIDNNVRPAHKEKKYSSKADKKNDSQKREALSQRGGSGLHGIPSSSGASASIVNQSSTGNAGGRALGLRAGSVSSYGDEENLRGGRLRSGPSRLHRVSSLEGNKVLMNLSHSGQRQKNFADFVNHGTLGEGAFSYVYKVQDPDDGEFYAVKRSKQRIKNKSDRTRYLQEPKMFKKLDRGTSSNVLCYYRAWQEEGYFYTQTELCPGGNLKSLLEQLNNPPVLPEKTIWYIIKQVATGLDQLHTQKLVHMDIKPDNILISATGVLKLGDLGMARQVNCSEDGHEGDAVYMAPELLESSVMTRQLDMFSFGVMIWELASGRFPPREGVRWSNFRKGMAEEPPPELKRSKRLCDLIRSLMHPQPRYRPLSSEVVEKAGRALKRYANAKGAAGEKTESSIGCDFILRILASKGDQAKKRRRTMNDGPTGITSSGSFQSIIGNPGPSGGLRLSIPANSFDPMRVHQERMGMSTPTEQIVGLSYSGLSTPSYSRK